jgi:hypothetical protein
MGTSPVVETAGNSQLTQRLGFADTDAQYNP